MVNITTTYVEHKHKNTGTSAKTGSLKPSFGLSIEI